MLYILQLFSVAVTSQFVNLEDTELNKSEMSANDTYHYWWKIMISESKQIQIQRVIGVMQFLGDADGIYSSIFILREALNFCFTGKD